MTNKPFQIIKDRIDLIRQLIKEAKELNDPRIEFRYSPDLDHIIESIDKHCMQIKYAVVDELPKEFKTKTLGEMLKEANKMIESERNIKLIKESDNLTYSKAIEAINKGGFNEYTDRMDVSIEISLFEYGIIRNPITNECLFYPEYSNDFPDDNKIVKFKSMNITFKEVKEYLTDNATDGFFSYIGSNKKKELKRLSNDMLAYMIFTINQYDGYFNL